MTTPTTPPTTPEDGLLAPGEPVDLDNCAREPIHVPGLIQPHGVLLAVRGEDMRVVHASDNLPEWLGRETSSALGRPLVDVLGAAAGKEIARHARAFTDLRERNPLLIHVEVGGRTVPMDAVLHRPPQNAGGPSLLVIELEQADGARPFSFPNTYQAVRGAVNALNRAVSLDALYEISARQVRLLTGFDRVMIYRFDDEYNGEVVAEDRREDLESFLGLHYPATDIPTQARALYEKNWIRLIADVDYAPVPVLPVADPPPARPLDMTFSVLRSVSPIHLEYLRNMGVRASMSISLLREGRLWGLIACHHYSGPHLPPYGVRAAAEFLGSTLSLRLVDRVEEEQMRAALRAQNVLAALTRTVADEDQEFRSALLGEPNLLDLITADGVYVRADGRQGLGRLPDFSLLLLVSQWVLAQGQDVVVTESVAQDAPELHALIPDVAGILAVTLPDDQLVVWLRREFVHSVDWGGDPHNKAIARREDGEVRLGPRRSFDRWREIVRGRSAPWTEQERASAEALRVRLLETLYARTRHRMLAVEELQRSLLPQHLPEVPGWAIAAWYEPAAGGHLGGDWYDAMLLPDGRLALVVGDVAGHGMAAASVMAEMRHSLRAYLLRGDGPAESVGALDALVERTLPDQMATLVLAVVTLPTREVEVVSVGHPPPFVIGPDGVRPLDVPTWPPLGVGFGAPAMTRTTLPVGGSLALFSDGLVERRDESLQDGLDRLAAALAPAAGPISPGAVARGVRGAAATDDGTLLVLRNVP